MKKYNLEDFLDWCKNNTKYNHNEILNELKKVYYLKQKFPCIQLYLTDEFCIIELMMKYINSLIYNNELIIGKENISQYFKNIIKNKNIKNPIYAKWKFEALKPNLYLSGEFLTVSIETAILFYLDDFKGYKNIDFEKMTLDEFELFLIMN